MDEYWSKLKVRLIHLGRLFHIAGRKFSDDECLGKAGTLSFVTILSVVPVIVLIIALLADFSSYDESLKKTFLDIVENKIIPIILPDMDKKEFISSLEKSLVNLKADNILGMGFLLIIAVDIMLILEKTINSIWHVEKGRSFIQNFLIYWAILTLGPIFLILSFYLTSTYAHFQGVTRIIFPLLLTWFGFAGAYMFIPRSKVSLRAALIGALVAGGLWEIAKLGFGLYVTEVAVPTWTRIYGPLYIIPIFVMWIYFSYAIFLFGAEISYLIQYPEIYRQKQYKHVNLNNFKLYFLLNTMNLIYESFQRGDGGITLAELAKRNNLSRFDMESIIDDIVNHKLIKEKMEGTKKEYFAIMPMDQIPVVELVNMATKSSQFLLRKDNHIVVQMFQTIMEKIAASKVNEFGQLNLKELADGKV